MSRYALPALVLLVGGVVGAVDLPAQDSRARPMSAADSAFAAADIALADSLYYLDVRQHPRDPIAREALGRYLAMRGASRIAAVLLEESRMFGGDPVRVAAQLAPLYESFGDWRALLSLPSSPLTFAQRKRAAWLSEHPSSTRADSTSLALTGSVRGDTVGRVTIRIAGRPVVAIVVARDIGLIVGARTVVSGLRRFEGDSATVVLDSINIGAARLAVVPATVDPTVVGAIIGMGALGSMTVTFDYAKRRVYFNQLRGTGRLATLPLFRDRGELRIAAKSSPQSPPEWSSLAALLASIEAGRVAGPATIDMKTAEVRIAY